MAVVVTAVAGVAATTAATTALTAAGYGAMTAAVAGALAGAVVSGVVGNALIDNPSSGNFAATAAGILTNKNINNASIPVIYGTRLSGGTIVFMDIPIDKQWFHVNLVVSEGEIEDFSQFYFNTQPAKVADEVLKQEYYGTIDQQRRQ